MPDNDADIKVISIDVQGQICPSTLLVALENLNTHKEALRRGEMALIIKTDNRHATVTIPETARNMGYKVTVSKGQGTYEIRIGRQAGSLGTP